MAWSRAFAARRACAVVGGLSFTAAVAGGPRTWTPSGEGAPAAPRWSGLPLPASNSMVRCEAAAPTKLKYGTVKLKDGRSVAYHDEGSGIPVIVFHGMGSSRLTWIGKQPLGEICPGVRLIALDRPGYGNSSPPPFGYSYTAFVQDVAEVANALGLQQFCVAGHSSGGPYALACAALLPDRVTAAAAVSSDAPYAHPHTPAELREADDMSQDCNYEPSGMYGRDVREVIEGWRSGDLAKGDPKKAHAWKVGTDGFICDYMLERLPWSFALESIALGPRLSIWVGGDDIPAIKIGAPFLNQLVTGSQLRVVPGGNHGFKSKPEHLAAILNELKSWCK